MKKVYFMLMIGLLGLASCSPSSVDSSDVSVIKDSVILKQGTFTTYAHDVSGSVKLYNNMMLEILNFTFDGGGPDVYVTLGNIEERFKTYTIVGDRLSRAYENETLSIQLESDIDLGLFNAVSILCRDFNSDFGSTILE